MLDLILLIAILAVALGFGFSNGMNDAANAIAASVGSRAISPKIALTIAALGNLSGCIVGAITGAAVAKTIGKGVLSENAVIGQDGNAIIIGAVLAAIVWTIIATRMGLPISVSHSLVAGLVGAGIATGSDIGWEKVERTASAVAIAPLLGFASAFVLMVLLLWIFYKAAPGRVRNLFKRMQYVTTAFLAYAHGNNDGQMPIALMIMGLVLYTNNPDIWDDFPMEVIVAAAASISLGTALGGWRVIKTVGFRITRLEPQQGFISDLSAGGVIEFASHWGIPVSTTHCSVSSVMGVGATRRLSAIRWGVTGNIVVTWILTFPICIFLGWLLTTFAKPLL